MSAHIPTMTSGAPVSEPRKRRISIQLAAEVGAYLRAMAKAEEKLDGPPK